MLRDVFIVVHQKVLLAVVFLVFTDLFELVSIEIMLKLIVLINRVELAYFLVDFFVNFLSFLLVLFFSFIQLFLSRIV